MRKLLAGTSALLAAGALAACGGGEDPSTTTEAQTGPCSEIQEVEIGPVAHDNREFVAADYATNPPAWGDHTDAATGAGTFYPEPPPLGETVHLLEHGAVIAWTNDLEATDSKAVEEEVNEIFQDGYYQLAVVENPELEVPFALSAWGALQTCEEVETSVIRPFVEEWYASPKSTESSLACAGPARSLPPC